MESQPLAIVTAVVPDAPVSLKDVVAITTAYQIGLDWSAGANNGGSPVLDHDVYYAVERQSESGPLLLSLSY